MSRRSLFLCVAVGLVGWAAPRGSAQNPKSEPVTFDTADHVEISGTYWPSTKGKRGPVAILLHRTGSKSSEEGWKTLAEELQTEGFAVLTFDFRGHGGSVNVGAKFWDMTHNKMHVRRKAGPPPATVSFNDFQPRYWPYLINDIAAARRFLERRYNDQGECNVSNMILVGAEDGATLGGLWVASEAKRYRLLQTGSKNDYPESKDIIACVWLSISNNLGPTGKGISVQQQLPTWLKEGGSATESKVPMVFVYGKKDTNGDGQAYRLAQTLRKGYMRGATKLPKDDPLKATGDYGVPETALQGAKLLSKSTSEWIAKTYIPKLVIDEKKPLQEWEKRESEKWIFLWEFANMHRVFCNPGMMGPSVGKLPNVVPLAPLRLTP